MNLKLYFKLAFSNIRNNKEVYTPAMIVLTFLTMMYYLIVDMDESVLNSEFIGAQFVEYVLSLGLWVVLLFSVIFFFYVNSFIMKRRKAEIGLYNVLGMDQKNLGIMVAIETGIEYLITTILGILLGTIFFHLAVLMFEKMSSVTLPVRFLPSARCVGQTALSFAAVYLLLALYNLIIVKRAKPIEMMRASQEGEKEPKSNVLVAIIGIGLLGAGYYLAWSVQDLKSALGAFFIAVLLVIGGTYLTFTAAITWFLKRLKKKKRFYYKKKNFIPVSSLIYRMKKNAAGLASICILSTMVIVTLTFSLTINIGRERAALDEFPLDYRVLVPEDMDAGTVINEVEEDAKESGVTIENLYETKIAEYFNPDSDMSLQVIDLDDYNRLSGEDVALGENQVLATIYSERPYTKDTIPVGDAELSIAGPVQELPFFRRSLKVYGENGGKMKTGLLVVRNFSEINDHLKEDDQVPIYTAYFFNGAGSERGIESFSEKFDALREQGLAANSRKAYIDNVTTLYGSVLFIGTFLGVIFCCGAGLILYYKQTAEAWEDRERYATLKKVGMTPKEVKGTINREMILMFLLPVVAAVIHILFATKMIRLIAQSMYIYDPMGFFTALALVVGIFIILYVFFYFLTGKAYQRIVE